MKFKRGDNVRVIPTKDWIKERYGVGPSYNEHMQKLEGKIITIQDICDSYTDSYYSCGCTWLESWLEPAKKPKLKIKDLL